VLFALLFSSPEPVGLERIRQVLYPAAGVAGETDGADQGDGSGGADGAEAASPREHLEALEVWILERQLPLQVRRVGGGWRMLTTEDVADDLEVVRKQVRQERVGPAALEVLSLVAYRQPVLKADVDAIRGVNSASHLRHLLDLRMVRILGRADVPGRPFLYGTTREFLDQFGLRDLGDLPEAGRLAFPAEVAPPEVREQPAQAAAAVGAEDCTDAPDESASATALEDAG